MDAYFPDDAECTRPYKMNIESTKNVCVHIGYLFICLWSLSLIWIYYLFSSVWTWKWQTSTFIVNINFANNNLSVLMMPIPVDLLVNCWRENYTQTVWIYWIIQLCMKSPQNLIIQLLFSFFWFLFYYFSWFLLIHFALCYMCVIYFRCFHLRIYNIYFPMSVTPLYYTFLPTDSVFHPT